MKSTISSQTGPAAASTSANTPTNSAANTTSAARPRPQPWRTSAATTGSSPSASTAARKIDSRVPSDTIARTTSTPKTNTCSSVRVGMTISTRSRRGASAPRALSSSVVDTARATHHDPAQDQAEDADEHQDPADRLQLDARDVRRHGEREDRTDRDQEEAGGDRHESRPRTDEAISGPPPPGPPRGAPRPRCRATSG